MRASGQTDFALKIALKCQLSKVSKIVHTSRLKPWVQRRIQSVRSRGAISVIFGSQVS